MDLMMQEYETEGFSSEQNAYKWKALATVALGTATVSMDVSIVNISFPILTEVFNAELTTVVWVSLVFTLVGTSLMLVLGRIGDYIGRKRIYTAGLFIFTLGLIACSMAQGAGQLILFRALQAVGASMTIACGQAIITEAFPPYERGKGLGFLGMAVSVGFILGPILGGFLLKWLDWRSIFYVRIPVGLIISYMALVLLKKGQGRAEKVKLDLLGAFAASIGLFCLVFGMSQVNTFGLKSPMVHIFIGAGILSLVAFILVERSRTDPIVDVAIFKNRAFSCAIWALFLNFVAGPFFILIMPFYLMQGIGLSSSATGLLFAVISIGAIVGSPISGSLSDRFGSVWFATLGAGAMAAAFFFMRGFDLRTTATDIIPILALFGFGIGAFHAPNNSTMMGAVSIERLGTASALIATSRQVGMSIGMALAGTIFTARRVMHQAELSQQGLDSAHAATQSIPHAFRDGLLISLILQLTVILLSFIPYFYSLKERSGETEP
jgi:EmrB/QacA subfamily drug resistance transporter